MRLWTGPKKVEIMQFEQEDAMSRVHHVLGLGCARALCRVKCPVGAACGLEGVISKLKDGHASDQFMFLFINGRFVEQTPIHRQIANFYATSSLSDPSQGRGPMSIATAAAGNLRPLFVLNLVCPTDWYDLNFLPDRSVVQFKDWKLPIRFILDCLRSIWERSLTDSEISRKRHRSEELSTDPMDPMRAVGRARVSHDVL
eukprot:symbB.v1.2.028804.t1/scaffold3088.1/size63905/4